MRKNVNPIKIFLSILLVIIFLIFCFTDIFERSKKTPPSSNGSYDVTVEMSELEIFANKNGLSLDMWPENLIELMNKNPETKDFVLNYPLKKNSKPEIDLNGYANSNEFPLLMQWDERWGYTEYADELFALSGCGPTCLSMVCIYLLKDATLTPTYIADFSEKNGYSLSENGSSWTLISQGGKKLGLDVTEIPLVESRIIKNLEVGNPIICVVGPGDFTSTGHFIVMTKTQNGKIIIHDPNSKEKSNRLWEYSQIQGQLRNLWVMRRAK